MLGSWRLIRDPLDVLLESAPRGIDVDEVGDAMCRVAGVREVHDLHIWTVTSGFPALAAHLRTDPHADMDAVRAEVEPCCASASRSRTRRCRRCPSGSCSIEDRRRAADEPE